jgi:hypothetical protein
MDPHRPQKMAKAKHPHPQQWPNAARAMAVVQEVVARAAGKPAHEVRELAPSASAVSPPAAATVMVPLAWTCSCPAERHLVRARGHDPLSEEEDLRWQLGLRLNKTLILLYSTSSQWYLSRVKGFSDDSVAGT